MKKKKVMKTQTTNYEIMLFTGTGFTSREICSKDENDKGRKLSPVEELEKACWDGLLYEMFPEILGSFSAKCESFIWRIINGKNFLLISIGSSPSIVENETSIDPYFYSLSACEN